MSLLNRPNLSSSTLLYWKFSLPQRSFPHSIPQGAQIFFHYTNKHWSLFLNQTLLGLALRTKLKYCSQFLPCHLFRLSITFYIPFRRYHTWLCSGTHPFSFASMCQLVDRHYFDEELLQNHLWSSKCSLLSASFGEADTFL